MLIIDRPQTDPYFNLAAEEYLLRNLEEDCFMLWINEPSVVLGKHQNAFAEIDADYVEKENIPVIRRISGGGTVFHDPGNLNFSFIRSGDREGLVDFRRFTQPIIEFLNTLGIPARFAGKNDIRVGDLKVSGNAEHVFRNKVLHHGTLLYDAKLGRLNAAIRGDESRYHDKAVKSVRSTVANISDMLKTTMSLESFQNDLLTFVKNKIQPVERRELSSTEIDAIHKLAQTRYHSWDWNFGYSPAFIFNKEISIMGKAFQVSMEVKQGKILSCEIPEILKTNNADIQLKGIRFRHDAIAASLIQSLPDSLIPQQETLHFVNSIFR